MSGLVAIVIAAAVPGLWLFSHGVELLRPRPKTPTRLRWSDTIPINYVAIGGTRLRYIKAGSGPTIVLLHTLRTQLDLFETVIPELSKHHTVYALDYPGHGYSDIPRARYDASFFVAAVEGFLEAHDLRDVALAGVSIGGVIPLLIGARRNPRVACIVSINPYDYAKGRGLARSSLFGWMTTYASLVPLLGETWMRLRSFPLTQFILRGGVARPSSISPALMREMHRVGNRPWHYRAFIALLRNGKSWELAREQYGRIDVPVLLVYGDRDWSQTAERARTRARIPNVVMKTIEGGGHFLPLDRPQELLDLLGGFVDAAAKDVLVRWSAAGATQGPIQ
jgi:pimeloyl-ACP methyl ester carboxylesterase